MMKDSSLSHTVIPFMSLFLFFCFSPFLRCCIWNYVEHILSQRIMYGFMIEISFGYVIFNVFFL